MDILRVALEDESGEDKKIVLRGPLADAYRDALQIELSKKNGENLSTETIQMDNEIVNKVVTSLVEGDQPPPTDSYQTVYGVFKKDVSDETVVDVVKTIADDASRVDTEFVLIIDSTDPDNDGEMNDNRRMELTRVTESLMCVVEAHGGKCYSGISEFIKNR